eukprot:2060908-Amphidinium_carterae.1
MSGRRSSIAMKRTFFRSAAVADPPQKAMSTNTDQRFICKQQPAASVHCARELHSAAEAVHREEKRHVK